MSRNAYANYYRVHGKFPPGVATRISVIDRAYLNTQRRKAAAVLPKGSPEESSATKPAATQPAETQKPTDAIAELPKTPAGVKTRGDMPSRKSEVKPQRLEGLTVLSKRPAVPLSKKAQMLRKRLDEVEGDDDSVDDEDAKLAAIRSKFLSTTGEPLPDLLRGEERDAPETLSTPKKPEPPKGASVGATEAEDDEGESEEEDVDPEPHEGDFTGGKVREAAAALLLDVPEEEETGEPKATEPAEAAKPAETTKPPVEKVKEAKRVSTYSGYTDPQGETADAVRLVGAMIGQRRIISPAEGKGSREYVFFEISKEGVKHALKVSGLSNGAREMLKAEKEKAGGMPVGFPLLSKHNKPKKGVQEFHGVLVAEKGKENAYEMAKEASIQAAKANNTASAKAAAANIARAAAAKRAMESKYEKDGKKEHTGLTSSVLGSSSLPLHLLPDLRLPDVVTLHPPGVGHSRSSTSSSSTSSSSSSSAGY